MIRSLRWGSALLLLALVGLTWGQTSSPTSPPGRMHTVSVQTPGKPAQVCQIVKTWNEADGSRAYQVVALDTGEWMTVLESTGTPTSRTTTGAQAISTRVFRYGRSKTPPPGVPAPPANAVAVGNGNALPIGTSPSPVKATPPGYVTTGTTSQYHKTSGTAMPSMPTILIPPSAMGPAPTILPPPPTTTASVTPTVPPVVSVPAPVPVAAPVVSVPKVLPPVPTPVVTNTALKPLPPETPSPTVSTPVAETPVSAVSSPVKERADDWRKSWGRVETPKETIPLVSAPVSVPQPLSGSEKLPVARNERVDPLSQPAVYSKTPARVEKALGQPLDTPASLAVQGPSTPTKTSMVTMPPAPAATPVTAPAPAIVPAPVAQEQRPAATPYAAPGATVDRGPITSPASPPAVSSPYATPTVTAPTAPTAPTPKTIVGTSPQPTTPSPIVGASPPRNTPSPILSPIAAVGAGNCPTSKPCVVCPTPAPNKTVACPVVPTPASKSAGVTSTATCIPCQQGTPATGVAGTTRLTPIPAAVVTQPKRLTPVVAEPKKPTPTPTPVVKEPKKPAPVPTPVVKEPIKPTPIVAPPQPKVVKKPEPTPARTTSVSKWNPFGGPTPPVGMQSVTAAGSRELQENPQPILIVRQEGGPLSVTPPANAFVEPIVRQPAPEGIANAFSNPTGGHQPIPFDRVRKDLMPPELVALLERQQREQGQGRPGMPMPPLPGNLPPEAYLAGAAPTPPTPKPVPQPILQVSNNSALEQLRSTVQDGLLPSDREIAADQLATYDPNRTPEALAILVTAARMDPATTVRVACVRAIGRMGARTPEVMDTLQGIVKEGDPQVQQAAREVLALIAARQ